jgi:ABC-type nitrate/sulfonate/bicarbonate transport system permease component
MPALKNSYRKWFYSLLSIISIVAIWQVLCVTNAIDVNLIPSPIRVWYAIIEWAKSGELLRDFSDSIWRGLLGLFIGASVGIFLGLLTGRSHLLNLILTPVLNVFKAFPPVAMLPVFITFLGIGDFSKVFAISFASLFPLWVNTHLGASSIPIEFTRSASLLSRSKTRIFFRVIIPASMNSIIAGFRIGIAISFIMLYVSELAGASSGLGYQISSSHLAYRMDKMLGALIVLGLTASFIDALLNRLLKKIFPWVQINKVI